MSKQISYKGYQIAYDVGYIVETRRDMILLVVQGLGKNVIENRGETLPNLIGYAFDVQRNNDTCHVELSINYVPSNISELVQAGNVDPPQTYEPEAYSTIISAHSKNPRYLDDVISLLKDDLKWLGLKREIPRMQISMHDTFQEHMSSIDEELSQQ